MKTVKILGISLLVALAVGSAHMLWAVEKGKAAPGQEQEQGWFCPWAGQGYYGMGPGMMGRGFGWGGMMGPDRDPDEYWGRGGMMGYGHGYRSYNRSGKPMTMDQAKVLLEHYLNTIGNPNLKGGKVTDKESYFEAEVVTKDGSLVDRLKVDKKTGWMRSVY